VRRAAWPLTGAPTDYDELLEWIGDARFVLLGEATHGTHEFYRERAEITKRLIRERGFHAVAVEADWPDALRVNAYVNGRGADADAEQALSGFLRFPTWMWRNADVLDFVGWLRERNADVPSETAGMRVGFFGLDVYSMYASIAAVLAYLDRVDPAAAARARRRYACFDSFGEDPRAYAPSGVLAGSRSCEEEALRQLCDLQQLAVGRVASSARDGRVAEDELFYVQENARVVRDAEEYYRSVYRGSVASWNLRDAHMFRTLDDLAAHLDRRVGRSKIVVWEHNSHVGDARATDMTLAGEWNLGQLARERWPGEAFIVGFTTYEGTVTAASVWEGPAERKVVSPALAGSYEAAFHAARFPGFFMRLGGEDALPPEPEAPLERAIGVVYRPGTERASHYFHARLRSQFDAVVHIDRTRAVEPLERAPSDRGVEPSETFPFTV
jgi:erythromycin esterase-like protein